MSELLTFILDRQQQFRRGRLASLYSDFRHLETINPDGYAANILAWRTALSAAAREGAIPGTGSRSDLLVLRTGEDLLQELESKEWGRPLALETVIKESVASKDLIPLQDFLNSATSLYHTSWVVTPWQIIRWGLRQLGLAEGPHGVDKLSVGRFVLLANVEECAQNILKYATCKDRIDRIYSKEMFKAQFSRTLGSGLELTETDFDVVLTYLARDKKEIGYDDKTVKFKSPKDSSVTITTQDTTIASLKTLIADHTAQIASLTRRVDDLTTAARVAVAKNSRTSALAYLRSKKLAESTLSRRSEMLGQLEEVYSKIEQATDQVETVRVMEASSNVLKSLNTEAGGVEKVEDVVEQLRVEMDQVNEVGAIINEPGLPNGGVEEGEVDDELETLEREQREELERKEAAKTKERLAEIDTNESQRKTPEPGGIVAQKELEESMAGLSRMSLEEEGERSASPANRNQEEEMNTS
ncbi:MAG: hypothetical protein M1837_001203 [Sclerophora amabilis]|nr:MAG: hypothetical protein M1837_001203 [Sclerophora amabilis]